MSSSRCFEIGRSKEAAPYVFDTAQVCCSERRGLVITTKKSA